MFYAVASQTKNSKKDFSQMLFDQKNMGNRIFKPEFNNLEKVAFILIV